MIEHDVFRSPRKEAQGLLKITQEKHLKLDIAVFGALHEGIPGDDIIARLQESDLTSLELPSISVVNYQAGNDSRIKEKTFWRTAIDNSRLAVGVNNNRAAVNGIRILDDRVRRGQGMPQSSADLAISGRNIPLGNLQLAKLEINDPLFLSQFKEPPNDSIYPYRTSFFHEGVDYWVHVNKPVKDKAIAAAATGNYMLPTEHAITQGAEIFGEVVNGITGIELTENALSHFIRTHVDKSQIAKMLDVSKRVAREAENGSTVKITHLGGAAHNSNLLPILIEVLRDADNVFIHELRDNRMPEVAPDKLTFFGKHIPISESLSALEIYEDQIFVNVEKTNKALQKVASSKGMMGEFAQKELFAKEFEDLVGESDNEADIEFFTARNLLTLLSNDEIEELGGIDADFIKKASSYISRVHPEYEASINEIMKKYDTRKKNFPKTFVEKIGILD